MYTPSRGQQRMQGTQSRGPRGTGEGENDPHDRRGTISRDRVQSAQGRVPVSLCAEIWARRGSRYVAAGYEYGEAGRRVTVCIPKSDGNVCVPMDEALRGFQEEDRKIKAECMCPKKKNEDKYLK
ncbi:hypothetical protein NPIL_230071 [Nephila pilipes]|uniref:Uncharacterized protein n=1 Tax=Nephila pilipes TaxID=299642 RepID=A0A8X6IZK6_NEPPI|nr:hypothetical protein NPIL_230071 [Nephila pilipes]